MANWSASSGFKADAAATTNNGKINRIPKTAIKIPTVRKMRCHNGSIRPSILALTTALSKDRLISRIPKIATVTRAATPPKKSATNRPAADTNSGILNVFHMTTSCS